MDLGCSVLDPAREGRRQVQRIYLPLIFTKRLCDLFDDELNRIAKEVGSRAKAFSPTDLLRTPVCQAAAYRQFLAARTGLEFMRAGPVFPLLEGKRLYERRREAAKSGSKRLLTFFLNVKQDHVQRRAHTPNVSLL